MGKNSAIEWTDATWNPWQGCHKVSGGCEHCYMFREKTAYGQDPNVVVRSKPPTFNLPLRLKEPQKVFTCSWSDFFIQEADPWREEAWEIIDRSRHLTYQILTKRIERAATRLPWGSGEPWPHVHLIVSVEDQPTADKRIPILLDANVAIRGISAEPLLGPIEFPWASLGRVISINKKTKIEKDVSGIVWVIIGGESGPHARPMKLEWAYDLVTQCRSARVAVFVKQLGARPYGMDHRTSQLMLTDRKGGNWEEWPELLRVREFPTS